MITIRTTTWWFLAGTLASLLFIVIVVAYSETLETVWLRESFAPQLQRDFGFRAAEVRVNAAFPDTAFVITEVVAGGPFARAGFRVGDRPWDYHGRNELGFYERFRSRGGPIVVPVTRLESGADIPKLVRLTVVSRPRRDSARSGRGPLGSRRASWRPFRLAGRAAEWQVLWAAE